MVKYGSLDADFTDLAVADPAIETHLTHERIGQSLFRRAEVVAGGRVLTARARWDDNHHTTWVLEHYLKDEEDVRAFIALPHSRPQVAATDFERVRADLEDRGLMMMHIADPMCYVADLLDLQPMAIMAVTNRDLLDALFEAVWARMHSLLVAYLEAGLGPIYRIFGAEFATPPMLSPRLFERWVVRYDAEMIELIQAAGGYARFHCHGRLRNALPMIRAMHPDILEPCEAPPSGDITMAELVQVVRDEFVLMGNIQATDMEAAPPEEIERQARELIAATRGSARFILSPTAGLFSQPLSPSAEQNFIRLVETAL